jgi:hypothetical protein
MDSQVWTATIPTLPTEQRNLATREARPKNPRKISREVPSLGFISRTKRQRLHVSVLRHPDLQPNNIFVSNNGGVTSLIVLPTFFAAGIPNSFQNYGDSGSQLFMPPTAPAGLDSLDDFERAQAQETFRRRHVHFHHLGLTQRMNQQHWRVLADDFDILRCRIFDHASERWEGLNTTLQYDLVQVSQAWDRLHHGAVAPECPVSFTKEEANRIDALDDSHCDADGDTAHINELLRIGSDGWTPHERLDYAESKAVEIQALALASVEDDPWLKEMSRRHWPFDDFDEDV